MHQLWHHVLQTLHARQIRYCVLRDGETALDDCGEAARCEIDLLIEADQLAPLAGLLSRLGFLHLSRWGYAPHHFFVAYDEESGGWLKLDVVTRISLGRPVHSLNTSLGEHCLANRRQVGDVFVPDAADELAALLLHCVVDKGRFEPKHRERIRALRQEVTATGRLEAHLSEYWPEPMTWSKLAAMLDEDRWDELLERRVAVTHHLRKSSRWRTALRYGRDRVLRKLHRLVRMLRPQSVSVALLAPDGAGKSTVADHLQNEFYFPTRIVYMGLYQQKAPARRVKVPGLGIVWKVLKQQSRYVAARCSQLCGKLVVFDRYTYDALLPTKSTLSLPGRMRRWILAHACPAPDLVVVLDAPAAVLFGRKGEHNPELLEEQRQGYLQLAGRVRRMVVVDATQGTDRVCSTVTASIWRRYLDRERGGSLL